MSSVKSQPLEALVAFQAATFAASSGHELPYRVLWPKDYSPNNKRSYPLVLFLHGAGERGVDNQLQLTHGTPLFLENRDSFPAIVLLPQCATEDYWAQVDQKEDRRWFNFDEAPNPSLAAVQELLAEFIRNPKVDSDRVYLMGLSLGGMGTFELLARQPETFAAAIPICGGGNPSLLSLYAGRVPMWVFHGSADKVVRVENSRRMVDACSGLGVTIRYTEYKGVGHNSWDNAFAEPDLLPWLFSHFRKR